MRLWGNVRLAGLCLALAVSGCEWVPVYGAEMGTLLPSADLALTADVAANTESNNMALAASWQRFVAAVTSSNNPALAAQWQSFVAAVTASNNPALAAQWQSFVAAVTNGLTAGGGVDALRLVQGDGVAWQAMASGTAMIYRASVVVAQVPDLVYTGYILSVYGEWTEGDGGLTGTNVAPASAEELYRWEFPVFMGVGYPWYMTITTNQHWRLFHPDYGGIPGCMWEGTNAVAPLEVDESWNDGASVQIGSFNFAGPFVGASGVTNAVPLATSNDVHRIGGALILAHDDDDGAHGGAITGATALAGVAMTNWQATANAIVERLNAPPQYGVTNNILYVNAGASVTGFAFVMGATNIYLWKVQP